MARLDNERRALAVRVRALSASENQLTPVQARLFVRTLQISWQVPPIVWGAQESVEQWADARRLLHAGSIFTEVDEPGSIDATACYRRAAELLEWLARSSDPVTIDVPVALLAAGAYQLAGLPAMATSLLRSSDHPGPAAAVIAAFLRADFDDVLDHATTFWRNNPTLTGRAGSASLLSDFDAAELEHLLAEHEPDGLKEDAPKSNKIGRYLVAECIRALGLFANAVRKGQAVRVQMAIEKLDALATLSVRLTSDEMWILFSLLEAAAKGFARNSIHSRTERLADRRPDQRGRMWAFARTQFARGRGILWTSQVRGLDRLIERDSFALCTPTGSGKTLVANLALVKELLLVEPGPNAPLALYLVPSRALAGEVEAKLTSELGSDVIVTGLYGGADWGITDVWLTAERPVVLIATVEKAEALMRYVGHLLMRRLRLLVIDEAHQVVGDKSERAERDLAAHMSRPMRLEAFVSRLLNLKPDMARIALTAVAGGAALPVARWIENTPDASPIGLGYRSSRQIIGALLCHPDRAPQAILEMMNGQILYVRGREQPVFLPLRIPQMPQPLAIIRNSLPHHTELCTLWTALHLLEGGRRILISVAQSPERLMKRYAEAFTLAGWNVVPAFVPPVDDADRALFNEARATCLDYCGAHSYEIALLDRGIATSHGQMPQRLRRLMTALIERRICPLTIATATLTEGVNLPFDIIFLTSIVRRSFDAEEQTQDVEPMSTAEFRNLAGRAGRPGAAEAIEGITLVVLPIAPSTTADGQRQTQRNQIERNQAQFNNLIGRLQLEEGAGGEIISPLSVLLTSIIDKCRTVLGLREDDAIIAWLEGALPEHVGTNLATGSRAPQDQLGDSMDELDGFLLAATEELTMLGTAPIDGPGAEALLQALWQRTFARVAAEQEAMLERCFIRRGRAFVERLYPNAEQRRRLYQFGFTPLIGRRFEAIAPDIIAQLQAAGDYGAWGEEARFQLFVRLGERIRAEPGIGFKVPDTVGGRDLLDAWQLVLGWWLQRPGAAPPPPDRLRAWQRFVADNCEFRLGVAVGAAVAQVWGQNAGDMATPTLELWRATTDLPWAGFWFRELLRWGTLDPLVAFVLSQGLAETREEARAMRPRYEAWLAESEIIATAEALIDPQNFLAWQRAVAVEPNAGADVVTSSVAQYTGVDGRRPRYDVMPLASEAQIEWIDPAGYAVAQSPYSAALMTSRPSRHDFEANAMFGVRVTRTY